MLHFTRLRLSAFKSFVEPTEVVIEPGLTGIVGPNGCGKSNLIEALRWVMGESSARSLRGDDMDDVIFAGAQGRPARDIAEVALDLDNGARVAPPPFHDAEEVTVSRRIDRGKGSVFRINGREVRARDVGLLFADAATGARSSAIVTQGQVAQLIAAKPHERRALLDEAAGITGLHARRREADLKLEGAEENLRRVDDVLGTLTVQQRQLDRQAKQAAHYRDLCRRIQEGERALLAGRCRLARAAAEKAGAALALAERAVADEERRVADATADHERVAAALPEARRAVAEIVATLQRLTLVRVELENEDERQRAAEGTARRELEQVVADLARQRAALADAAGALTRAREEETRLAALAERDGDAQARAESEVEDLATEVARAERELEELTSGLAATRGERVALERALAEGTARLARLDGRALDLARQRQALAEEQAGAPDPALAEGAWREATAELAQAETALAEAEAERARAAEAAAAVQAALRAAESAEGRWAAEERALAKLVAADGGADAGKGGCPVADALVVEEGLRLALAAVLADDLFAPFEDGATEGEHNPSVPSAPRETRPPRLWRALPPLEDAPALPEGASPLADLVEAPLALRRRLSQIGLLDDGTAGADLQRRLAPGQRLVDREGAVWRWDGFKVAAGRPTPAAVRLEQRARLAAVRRHRKESAQALAAANATAESAARAAAEAAAAVERARARRRQLETAARELREAHLRAGERHRMLGLRSSTLDEAGEALARDRGEATATVAGARQRLAALPDVGREQAAADGLRQTLTALRQRHLAARGRLDVSRRDIAARRRRAEGLNGEIASWRRRHDDAERHIEALTSRRTAAEAELAQLAALPADTALRRQRIEREIAHATERQGLAEAALAQAEDQLLESERGLRAGTAGLARAREQRIRDEAAARHAREAYDAIRREIAERLDADEDELPAAVAAWDGSMVESFDPAPAERRLEALRRERDMLGPVNLRAELEMEELRGRADDLAAQRLDLAQAVATLRRAIGELDREARQRLLAAFAAIDQHFRALFTRLFGGGRAELALTDADDPLRAGLEVMASPPGKRLQAMTLLSGGEQTLTALALRFALFRVRPTPLCVLDEVDAPLDDANVDRLCRLLADLAASGTRFLVITHHRMTMARMDRLYGVTMAEKGVSQLVSVDLGPAEGLRRRA